MLAIPYLTGSGDVVAFKFRCVRDHDCKAESCQRYDVPAGQKMKLYNAGALAAGGAVAAVVEGEIKAIVCTHTLGVPAVSTAAGVWLEHWPRTLADYERVIVVCDNDVRDDGSNPGLRHAKDKVLKTLPNGELVVPPPGLDLDDWILKDGTDAVKKAMGL